MNSHDNADNAASVSNSANERIYLVDAFDEVIGVKTRAEMRQGGLLHRVTYLLVFNDAGQLLVQTRTNTKDWYPGYLDFAAGGVVQEGESYDQSAERELEEELGISAPLTAHFKLYFEDRSKSVLTRSWGKVYSCTSTGPFRLQAEEVAAAEFMDVDQALAIDPSTVTPDTRQVLLSYLL